MNFLRLAYRNVIKNKRRSFYIIFIVAIAAFFLILFGGFVDGFQKSMFDQSFDVNGHLTIQRAGYNEASEFDLIHYGIHLSDEDFRALANWSHVSRVEKLLASGCILSNNDQTLNMVAMAYDPMKSRYQTYLVEGQLPQKGDVLIGKATADLMGLSVGDAVFLVGQTKYESPNAIELTVAGLFETGVRDEDETFLILNAADLQILIAFDPQEWSQLIVYLDDRELVDNVVAQNNAFLSEKQLNAKTWKEQNRLLLTWMEFAEGFLAFMFGIVLLVAGTGIVNTILGSIYDRSKELGTMRAIGMTPAHARQLIYTENFLLGICGFILGICVAFPLLYYLSTHGIDMGEGMGDFKGASRIVYTHVSTYRVLMVVMMCFVTVLIASWYPTRILLSKGVAELLGEAK